MTGNKIDKTYTGESYNPTPGKDPIEPEGNRSAKLNIIKWLFFLIFIAYIFISHYHVPILTHIGDYLILEHAPQKSNLIVCLGGGNIERGIATIDAYREGLAPFIYISRPALPDGYDLLKERGLDYPEEADLLAALFSSADIPESAIIRNYTEVQFTLDEAQEVKKEVEQRRFKSLIIITSPTHSRRAWLTYKKVFEGSNIGIISLPTRYSGFNPENWWKERKYIKDVLLEYQKLIYYIIRYDI